MNLKHKMMAGTAFAVLALTPAVSAHAQASSSPVASRAQTSSSTVDEVIVTATKTGETKLQKTPIAIAVVSDTALRNTETTSIRDLPNLVSGLKLSTVQIQTTLFIRGVLCNWMVSTGVILSMVSSNVLGKIVAMWLPISLFFYMGFEHSIVNMFLFPSGLLLGADFTIMDYLIWNEIPTVVGNLVGGLLLAGLPLYLTYGRTVARKVREPRQARAKAGVASPAEVLGAV